MKFAGVLLVCGGYSVNGFPKDNFGLVRNVAKTFLSTQMAKGKDSSLWSYTAGIVNKRGFVTMTNPAVWLVVQSAEALSNGEFHGVVL